MPWQKMRSHLLIAPNSACIAFIANSDSLLLKLFEWLCDYLPSGGEQNPDRKKRSQSAVRLLAIQL
jgi:hypothetical protein